MAHAFGAKTDTAARPRSCLNRPPLDGAEV